VRVGAIKAGDPGDGFWKDVQRARGRRWLVAVLAIALSGCNASGLAPSRASRGAASARFAVIAAENTWGSLALQLAGSRAAVASIIVNPSTDPHSYEPTAQDARAIARSSMVIVNGIGYDTWASRLVEANGSSDRTVLDVGKLLGLAESHNPHQWYSPGSVERVIAAITADYERIDPADAAFFAARERQLRGTGLARYDALLTRIRRAYKGVPIGFSESIFEPLGEALGLDLRTRGFARSVAAGTDVTVADKESVDALVRERKIAVWVFNTQNVTPDVKRINQLAHEQGIPVATVTETLSPASATFEQWQAAQLESLLAALERTRVGGSVAG
jgi:zinc/manganese transport system substrate-binding protein